MQAVRVLRTPRAAGVAGVAFAVLLAMTLVLLRAGDAALADHRKLLLGGRIPLALTLVPFTGIAFLWFVGVVRDRIGEREDRFLATVSLGSGLLFVAMLFMASGVAAGALQAAGGLRGGSSTDLWALGRTIAAVLLNTYAMRMAAVFMVSTSTIGLRTSFMPRWLGFSGYAIALILLLGIKLTLWIELLFPLWVLILSLEILVESFREDRTGRQLGDQSWDSLRTQAQRKSA